MICTELHEAQRIDRQLIGRCGRQGDPGTYRQFLALDDELLETGFGPARETNSALLAGAAVTVSEQHESLFRRAQRRIERRHYRQRRALMYAEHERRKMQTQMGQDPYLDSPN